MRSNKNPCNDDILSHKNNQVEEWSSDYGTVCLRKSTKWNKFPQSGDTLSGKTTRLEQIPWWEGNLSEKMLLLIKFFFLSTVNQKYLHNMK